MCYQRTCEYWLITNTVIPLIEVEVRVSTTFICFTICLKELELRLVLLQETFCEESQPLVKEVGYYQDYLKFIEGKDQRDIISRERTLCYLSFDLFKRNIICNIKGTLMQMRNSANIFVFIWKQYVEDFTLKHLLVFKICAREIYEKFVYKHLEQKNMLKINLLFKKFTNFTGK